MKQIAFISDIHLDEQFVADNKVDSRTNWERILEDIRERGIKEIIFGGDIGESAAHAWFFETLQPFSFKLIIGNHDKYKQVSKYYKQGSDKDELYYQFEEGEYKYIFLDSSADQISERQLTWLKKEVKTDKKILLFIHHPIVGINTIADLLYPLKNREAIQSVLRSAVKEVTVFSGHYHTNAEVEKNNIRQIISQAASYQLMKSPVELIINNLTFGYRIIEITPAKISTTRVILSKVKELML